MPYSILLPSQVKNFPANLKFGHPSFGIQSLKRILDAADAISIDFKCMLPSFLGCLLFHFLDHIFDL